MTQNGVRGREMRPDLCKFLVRSDVTTIAILLNATKSVLGNVITVKNTLQSLKVCKTVQTL